MEEIHSWYESVHNYFLRGKPLKINNHSRFFFWETHNYSTKKTIYAKFFVHGKIHSRKINVPNKYMFIYIESAHGKKST
jgi:hypothetical protein